jgi:hypothetical protein
MRLRILLGLWVLLVAVCSVSGSISAAKSKSAARTSTTPYPTYQCNMMYLSPLNVHVSTKISLVSSSGSMTTTNAQTGYVFVTVLLKVTNRNDVSVSVSSNSSTFIFVAPDFTIIPAYNNLNGWQVVPALFSRVLQPGHTITGAVAFHVPFGGHEFYLRWAPQPSCRGTASGPWTALHWSLKY